MPRPPSPQPLTIHLWVFPAFSSASESKSPPLSSPSVQDTWVCEAGPSPEDVCLGSGCIDAHTICPTATEVCLSLLDGFLNCEGPDFEQTEAKMECLWGVAWRWLLGVSCFWCFSVEVLNFPSQAGINVSTWQSSLLASFYKGLLKMSWWRPVGLSRIGYKHTSDSLQSLFFINQ